MNSFDKPLEIWVAFGEHTDIWWLRCLKKGFRHCLALVKTKQGWLIYDPLLHKTDMRFITGQTSNDLPRVLREQGFVVVKAPLELPVKRRVSLKPFTCVEAIKRLIGLQSFWVVTPYGLYRRLHELAKY